MGRGAQAQTRRMIDQQLAQQNAMNQQLYSSSQSLAAPVAAGYQSLLASPGYTDAEKSAVTNLSQSALASAFGALAQNAANRMARTRNSAGYGEIVGELARQQGRQQAGLAQQNQLAFGDASRADRQMALAGLAGLYGTDATLLGRALGIPASLLDARGRASQGGSSFLSSFGAGLGRALGNSASAFTGG